MVAVPLTMSFGGQGKMRPRKLKVLTKLLLGVDIQGGQHNPVRRCCVAHSPL